MTNREKFQEVFGFRMGVSEEKEVCPDGACEMSDGCDSCPFNEGWWDREYKSCFRMKDNLLHVGDLIGCRDKDDMADTSRALAEEGIETDFVYEKNGIKGLWLEVIKIG